ncbi:MAG: prolyl oligopeptidase family serine peptidase [Deltaproteobacteria bacterium]
MRRAYGLLVSILFACARPTEAPTTPITTSAPPPATPAALPTASSPATAVPSAAQSMSPEVSGYDKPPQNVLDVLHAPAPARPMMAPTRDRILLVSWVTYPSIAQVAEPYLKLAGVRLEPRTRRKHDTEGGYGVAPCAQTFAMVDVASTKETPIAMPAGCVDGIAWAPDGSRFAFRNTTRDAVELWIGDAATRQLHRLGNARLNPMLGHTFQWLTDHKTLVAKLVPDHQGPPPAGSVAADGPSIQETDGKSGESSTYEARDTLNNKHDEDLFAYYATSQLAAVDTTTGAVTPIGKPGVFTEVAAAPDDQHILVEALQRPYSYNVTYGRFAHTVEVWDRSGRLVHTIANLPIADRVPVAGVPTGPRDFEWRTTEPATLLWAEALDGGDWNVTVPARDKVMIQSAPFDGAPRELLQTQQRFSGLDWTDKKNLALLHDYDENRHWQRTFTVDVDAAKPAPAVLFDLSSDEHYKDPGEPVYRQLANGEWVIRTDGAAIFLSGEGATPDGLRPFLDRLDLATKKAERLFHSEANAFEYFLTFAGDTKTFFTWHQTPSDPPNAFLRTIGSADAKAITHIPDPTPAVRAIKKRLVKYKRKDGTELSFTLITPPGYVEGTRIPAILYAYPLDYASAKTAGQNSSTDQYFTRISDYQLLLVSGYAIIDNAAFPIVGDPKKAYDTYLEQLVDDANAAVNKAVELGVVDRDRIGVTGHSHGALMTANLVAHTNLFKAGVATSGSYNKTLTPFGFQNEKRSVWKGRDVYMKVSPFFFADKIKTPLLIMHGAEDANPGTTPLQATKLYEAIRGNGGVARLVMLPHEPHWYSAMESNEQLAYEELRWFDKYVKNAAPKQPSKPAR